MVIIKLSISLNQTDVETFIITHSNGADVFKFFDMGTKLVEAESGYSVNEPVNYAVRAAIEAGVIELINEGAKKEFWKFKEQSNE